MKTNDNQEQQQEQSVSISDLPKLNCSLTTSAIKQWLDSINVPCSEGMSHLSFRVEEENYTLHTDLLPMVSLVKRYQVEENDASIMERVMTEVDKTGRLAKAKLERDDEGNADCVMFQVTWVEGDIEHFKSTLREYIEILNNAVSSSQYYYHTFSSEEKDDKLAQQYPTLNKN